VRSQVSAGKKLESSLRGQRVARMRADDAAPRSNPWSRKEKTGLRVVAYAPRMTMIGLRMRGACNLLAPSSGNAIAAQAIAAIERHRQPRDFLGHQHVSARPQVNSVPQPEQASRARWWISN